MNMTIFKTSVTLRKSQNQSPLIQCIVHEGMVGLDVWFTNAPGHIEAADSRPALYGLLAMYMWWNMSR
jgi:hypothetical protein